MFLKNFFNFSCGFQQIGLVNSLSKQLIELEINFVNLSSSKVLNKV